MNYSIKQISDALNNLCILGGDKTAALEKLGEAFSALKAALAELDGLTVAGRSAIDTLLGCMMALESIVGKEDGNG